MKPDQTITISALTWSKLMLAVGGAIYRGQLDQDSYKALIVAMTSVDIELSKPSEDTNDKT